MEWKDRRDFFILGTIIFILIGLLIFSAVKFKMDEDRVSNTDSNIQNSGNSGEENNDTNSDVVVPSSTPIPSLKPSSKPSSSATPKPIPSESPNPSNSPTPSPTPSIDTTFDEGEVVSYFTSLEEGAFKEDDPSFKEKAKNAFVTVVDFLFYDKEIKGYTFRELTSSAKLKIIKIALSIDNKIDEYFPDYKNTIKEKMTNLKGKAALLYLETTAKLCDSVGESACEEARSDFKNMKETFGFTWDLIKSGASKGYSKLTEILSEWYQSIR